MHDPRIHQIPETHPHAAAQINHHAPTLAGPTAWATADFQAHESDLWHGDPLGARVRGLSGSRKLARQGRYDEATVVVHERHQMHALVLPLQDEREQI